MVHETLQATALPDDTTDGGARAAPPEKAPRQQMGTIGLVFTVLAFVAPLSAVTGFVPLVIGNGNGIGAPLMFFAIGVVLLIFAVGYTTMVRTLPRPGAFYAYISAGLGKRVGLGAGIFTAVWYLANNIGAFFFGGVMTRSVLRDNFGIDLPWQAFVFVSLAIVAFCTYRGVDFNLRIVAVIVSLEVLVILAFNIGTLVRGGPSGYATESFSLDAFTSGPIGVGALFATALFLGFETTAVYREEVRDPDRTIPRATYILIVIMSLFYGLVAWCLITALGEGHAVAATASDPTGSFITGLHYAVGKSASEVVSVLLITTVLATEISIANASSRYLYSFGVDGVLPRALSKLHTRHGSPHIAALTSAAVVTAPTLLLIGIGVSPEDVYVGITGVCTFAFQSLMLLMSVAVIVYFRRNRGAGESAWRVVIAPAVSVLCFGWLIYFTGTHSDLVLGKPSAWIPALFSLMVAAFAFGVGYACWLVRQRPAIFRHIGRIDEA